MDEIVNFLILGRMQKGMFEPIESSGKDSRLVTSEYEAKLLTCKAPFFF
jgi:hypothetical protein